MCHYREDQVVLGAILRIASIYEAMPARGRLRDPDTNSFNDIGFRFKPHAPLEGVERTGERLQAQRPLMRDLLMLSLSLSLSNALILFRTDSPGAFARVTAKTLIRSNPSADSVIPITANTYFSRRWFAAARGQQRQPEPYSPGLFSSRPPFPLVVIVVVVVVVAAAAVIVQARGEGRAADGTEDETIIGEVGNYRMTPLAFAVVRAAAPDANFRCLYARAARSRHRRRSGDDAKLQYTRGGCRSV